jgi:two-component system response regulator NreC
MKTARLLIVDDHEVFRRGLRSLLEPFAEWQICGEAVDGMDAIQQFKTLRPDIVVMDITMPQLNGLEATKLIKQQSPDTQVVIITQHDSPQIRNVALQSGATSFVTKSAVGSELVSAVKDLLKNLAD